MPIIGSSPLGLTFRSTYDEDTNTIGKYILDSKNSNYYAFKSIFKSGDDSVSRFGSKSFPNDNEVLTGTNHTDDSYETSVVDLVEYTKNYKSMRLNYSDFAYLKNLGVFPNNRLMIARRFAGPVPDDLTSIKEIEFPIATLISWVPDGENFIKVAVGEKWTESEGSFKEILNSMGKDVLTGKNRDGSLGGKIYEGISAIPLPGFMQGLQYSLLNKLGLTDRSGEIEYLLPAGDPNLIRQAKIRQTISDNTVGSGLTSRFSITMTVEYEQKFINGVDPTLVYYDIISNILSFATSNSTFQFNRNMGEKSSQFLNDMISGDIKAITRAIQGFVKELISALKVTVGEIQKYFMGGLEGAKKENIDKAAEAAKKDPNAIINSEIEEARKIFASILNNAWRVTVGNIITKYKIKIVGVINALTGAHSTPWHITIGNPKKPLFSSGDMYVDNVDIEMGNILSFNDLPSSIKATFTLNPARDYGAQEIFNKFSVGEGRTYRRLKDSFEQTITSFDLEKKEIKEDITPPPIPLTQIEIKDDEDIVIDIERPEEPYMLNMIYFKFDSTILSSDSMSVLDQVVSFLNSNINKKVNIKGHTDKRGSSSYNMTLSQKRASSCKDYLQSKGISSDRITTTPMGETAPIDNTNTKAGDAKNRRCEFFIT